MNDSAALLLYSKLPFDVWYRQHYEKLEELYSFVIGKIGNAPLLDEDNAYQKFCKFMYSRSSKKPRKEI